MKNNKQKLIPIVLVGFSCLLFIVAIVLVFNTENFKLSNQTGNQESYNGQLREESSNGNLETNSTNSNMNTDQSMGGIDSDLKPGTSIESNSNPSSSNFNPSTEEENKVENSSNVPSSDSNQEVVRNEANVISYFESKSNMLTENSNQEDRSLREMARDSFITVVDFIFYDKEIKGYTFKELTNTAKLQVIQLALTIDHKIDRYFPDYKEVIKDKYRSFKGKLAVKYLEFTSYLCETVGENTCNQAKEDFNTMKENFGFTWQFIKELASSGSNKVKEFYESWRDSK